MKDKLTSAAIALRIGYGSYMATEVFSKERKTYHRIINILWKRYNINL